MKHRILSMFDYPKSQIDQVDQWLKNREEDSEC
jgi:hypothetical protein